MKKITFVLAIVLSVLLALSGCSDTDIYKNSTPSAQNEIVSEYLNDGDPKKENNTEFETETQQSEFLKVDLSNIPHYTGKPYVAINNNIPYFTELEFKTTSFEKYSNLDTLGRCGIAYASIGQDLIPIEERGSIGMIKPSGWHTVKYDNVDGKYLYNRCHLIGFQLTGENANELNLITGTRYMNINGMLPFENMVADYVQETNNHVLYRVTPIYEGNNLLTSGVLMKACSDEDKGKDVSFCVFCYNVQPGIIIDYFNGESKVENGSDSYCSDVS